MPLNKAKDILLWNDLELSILNLDDATRRVVGETIAYEIDTFGQ